MNIIYVCNIAHLATMEVMQQQNVKNVHLNVLLVNIMQQIV